MRQVNLWGIVGMAAMFVVTLSTAALASEPGPAVVPEVSPASLSSALALVAGGALLVRARFGRK